MGRRRRTAHLRRGRGHARHVWGYGSAPEKIVAWAGAHEGGRRHGRGRQGGGGGGGKRQEDSSRTGYETQESGNQRDRAGTEGEEGPEVQADIFVHSHVPASSTLSRSVHVSPDSLESTPANLCAQGFALQLMWLAGFDRQ